jgi:hypothetical protein
METRPGERDGELLRRGATSGEAAVGFAWLNRSVTGLRDFDHGQ